MAMQFLASAGSTGPEKLESLLLSAAASRELETAHRRLIGLHLEKELKSARVLREMRHARSVAGPHGYAATSHLQAVRVLGVARLSPAATPRHRDGRRHDAPRDVSAGARAGPVERRLRPAVAPAGRRPLRREPEPPVQAPAVPGHPQAGAGRCPAALPAEPGGVRHRSARARHPLRGGQLGVADARRLGHRLAGAVRRPGDYPVHLLPAGRRHRSVADLGGADLRDRAPVR